MKVHPFAKFLPCATDEEYRNIRDDIRQNGLKVPLLLFNGLLLDGRTRLKACEELNVEAKCEGIAGSAADALRQVQSLNVFRRHLSPSQKAAVADSISVELQRLDGLTVKEARAAAAKATGAADSTVREAATIRRFSPKLSRQIINGEKTVEEAKREIRPTNAPIRSTRLVASAITELTHAIKELKRRRCPEKDRLQRIVNELEESHQALAAWARRRS